MMMKRAVSFLLFGLSAAALGGCPIFPADRDHRVCVGGDCYDCPDAYYSSTCNAWTCGSNLDCPSGYSCDTDHRCRLSGSSPNGSSSCSSAADCASGEYCGSDNRCHAGDCSQGGCPSGYVCKLSSGAATCEKQSSSKPPTGTASECKKDGDCTTPEGSKCLSGKCVAPADQCADATQCPAGTQCVQGACTRSCDTNTPCPTGYSCDDKGVCTGNPGKCSSSAQCKNGTVCVEEHCVDPCSATGACKAGFVCVDGGCTPDEKPILTCAADGPGTGCAAGSTCLRHSCYIQCDQANGDADCASADAFNLCKSVTTGSGTYSVCGSATNLGSDCDPTQSLSCSSPALVCIDGFCR